MKIGLHICDFTWKGGAETLATDFRNLAVSAEDAGFAKISVMDHVWQIRPVGPIENDMLEAYTALGYLAAVTKKVDLLAWVTAVVYRAPGLLAKCVTTLDVLSQGRAYLGIGAAWNDEESAGMGLDFPPTAERFERLEEALQIVAQLWSDDDGAYEGKHYHLGRTMNVPQPLRKPHPPILIGGSGEKKTLRMVAQYADACNLFAGPEVEHKLQVLKQHCENLGRDYDEIEKTVNMVVDVDAPVGETIDSIKALADLGITHVHHGPRTTEPMRHVDFIGEHIIPAVADF